VVPPRPAETKGQKLGSKMDVLKGKIRFAALKKLVLTESNVSNLGNNC
jgi:hypothetical protein